MTDLNQFFNQLAFRPELVLPYIAWATFWKGLALWKAAGKKQLSWFMILMVVNTLGLLEITYVFYLHRWELGSKKFLVFLKNKFKEKKQ